MKPQENEGGFDILGQLHGVVKPVIPTVALEAKPEEDTTIIVIKEDPQWLSITNDLLFH